MKKYSIDGEQMNEKLLVELVSKHLEILLKKGGNNLFISIDRKSDKVSIKSDIDFDDKEIGEIYATAGR